MTKLTISIVNFNAGKYLINCLDSIEKVSSEAEISTIVLDNASEDSSIVNAKKKFGNVSFIESRENLGFGKGQNKVLKNLNSEYVLMLNPDTVLKESAISECLDYMEKNVNAGAVTCKIMLPNGEIDLTAHRGFPTPWASLLYFLGNDSLYHLSKMDMSKPHEVDSISGAFFMTRKSILEKTGYFDEEYFMFAEDIDLSFRIKEAGYKIMYLPQVSIIHEKGVSTGLKKHSQDISRANIETRKKSLDAFYETMKIFYRKHYLKKYPSFVSWLVYGGINLKWWLAKRKMVV